MKGNTFVIDIDELFWFIHTQLKNYMKFVVCANSTYKFNLTVDTNLAFEDFLISYFEHNGHKPFLYVLMHIDLWLLYNWYLYQIWGSFDKSGVVWFLETDRWFERFIWNLKELISQHILSSPLETFCFNLLCISSY